MAGASVPGERYADDPRGPVRLVDSGGSLRRVTRAPPLQITGWRFQASADDGETHVFDVRRRDDRWELVRVFD